MSKERGIIRTYSLGVREIEPRKLTKQQKKDFKEASKILNAGTKRDIYPSKPSPEDFLW